MVRHSGVPSFFQTELFPGDYFDVCLLLPPPWKADLLPSCQMPTRHYSCASILPYRAAPNCTCNMHFSLLFLQINLAFISHVLGCIQLTATGSKSIPIGAPDYSYSILNARPIRTIQLNDHYFGSRKVAYYTFDGLAVIDGDIIYGPIDNLLANSGALARTQRQRKRAISDSRTWPSATVKFTYLSEETESSLSAVVNEAIRRWKTRAPYLDFLKLKNDFARTDGVVTITSFNGSCSASVGYRQDESVRHHMNLDSKTCDSGAATHEFGHVLGQYHLSFPKFWQSTSSSWTSNLSPKTYEPADWYNFSVRWHLRTLGLYHEHQRPDRGKHVTFHCANIAPDCAPGEYLDPPGSNCCDGANTNDKCCNKKYQFVVYDDPSYDSSGLYDVHSIMHYTSNAFAIDNTSTLTSSDPAEPIPDLQPPFPSQVDLERICKMYHNECLGWQQSVHNSSGWQWWHKIFFAGLDDCQ